MSKYGELCSQYKKAVIQYQAYQEECVRFVAQLAQGLIEYLACSPDKVEFVPVLHEPDENKEYFAAGALELADDGFYHFGIRLCVDPSTSSEIWSKHIIQLHFMLKKDKDAFAVKIENWERDFEITDIASNEKKAIYDSILDPLLNWYKGGFLPSENRRTKPLGFPMPELPRSSTT